MYIFLIFNINKKARDDQVFLLFQDLDEVLWADNDRVHINSGQKYVQPTCTQYSYVIIWVCVCVSNERYLRTIYLTDYIHISFLLSSLHKAEEDSTQLSFNHVFSMCWTWLCLWDENYTPARFWDGISGVLFRSVLTLSLNYNLEGSSTGCHWKNPESPFGMIKIYSLGIIIVIDLWFINRSSFVYVCEIHLQSLTKVQTNSDSPQHIWEMISTKQLINNVPHRRRQVSHGKKQRKTWHSMILVV